MTNKELKLLAEEILTKVKQLTDALNGVESPKKSTGIFGNIDKSSVLFEAEEGVCFPIGQNEESNDEDQIL